MDGNGLSSGFNALSLDQYHNNNNNNAFTNTNNNNKPPAREYYSEEDESVSSFPGSPYPSNPYASLASPPPPFHYPFAISNNNHTSYQSRQQDPFSHANGYRVADWTSTTPSSASFQQQQLQQPRAKTVPRTMMHGTDEVITNAIVIKNIPFAVPKETLLAVMEDLRLPLPFAFNYHYDNGQFRGLAFANFRQDSDAALTVTALNGFDLQGRKLRTEFKRVLKEGEKEKIEREKAIKRMRSQQQISTTDQPHQQHWQQQRQDFEEHDYGRIIDSATQLYSPFAAPSAATTSNSMHYSASPPSDVGTSISTRMTTTASSASSDYSKSELDLNDPQALEIYSRVLLFKDDSLRDELAFSRSLSPVQRRTVHLVAQKLNLSHKSVGEGDERHVVVFKASPPVSLGLPEASKPLRHASSTLGRHTSTSTREPISSLFSHDSQYPNATSTASTTAQYIEPSGSPLRTKKSMPDIRPSHHHSHFGFNGGQPAQAFQQHPSSSTSSSSAWSHNSHSGLASRRSGGNLRDQFHHQHSSSPTRNGTGNNNKYPSMKGLFDYQHDQQHRPEELPPVPPVPASLQSQVAPPTSSTTTTGGAAAVTGRAVTPIGPKSPSTPTTPLSATTTKSAFSIH